MLNKSVARRYAEAFFKIAEEAGKVNEYQTELESILSTIESLEDLKAYLAHLLIPAKQKKETVSRIFADSVSPVTINFISLIIDKRREQYLTAIVDEYCDMADEARNITKADLISAQAVSDEEVAVLAEKLSASTGKTVQIKQSVDASLIGGIKIRVGDRIIDASVAKKLSMLNEQLSKIKIS